MINTEISQGGRRSAGPVRRPGRLNRSTQQCPQPFGRGVCIARRGAGVGATFAVRKISNGVGVERIFPLHSPMLADIKVVRRGRVRRAKLYYLRNVTGKAASIVAKVVRDRLMRWLAQRHPAYHWERNAGYGTPAHLEGLRRAGLTAHHRVAFCRTALGGELPT